MKLFTRVCNLFRKWKTTPSNAPHRPEVQAVGDVEVMRLFLKKGQAEVKNGSPGTH